MGQNIHYLTTRTQICPLFCIKKAGTKQAISHLMVYHHGEELVPPGLSIWEKDCCSTE